MKQLVRFNPENPGRRQFLQVAAIAGGGFAIGMGPFMHTAGAAGDAPFAPNPFVRIGTDSSVTVIVKHLEM